MCGGGSPHGRARSAQIPQLDSQHQCTAESGSSPGVPLLMRRLLPIALAVSLSAGALLHAADDLVVSRFGDYLESLRVQAGIPGLAATIVELGEVRWERSFGLMDVERNIAARTDTPFHLDGTT